MQTEAATSNDTGKKGPANGNMPYRELRRRSGALPAVKPGKPQRTRLAAFLKARRRALGLTQQSLGRKLGVRSSHIALLENGRRKPSLGLVVRLAGVLGADGRKLLLLAHPEVKALLAPAPAQPRKLGRSWRRLLDNSALLARYRVTRRELEALQHLGMLGGKLTAKRLLAILMLVRDLP